MHADSRSRSLSRLPQFAKSNAGPAVPATRAFRCFRFRLPVSSLLGVCAMKSRVLAAVMAVGFLCISSQAFAFNLFGGGYGGGCGCDNTCGCEPTCGCQNDCAPKCCKQRCCHLFNRCCRSSCDMGCGCAAPSCAAPSCAAPSCAAPTCAAAPSCGCDNTCGCDNGCGRCHKQRCCKQRCCKERCCHHRNRCCNSGNTCGCDMAPACGCGG